MPQATIDTTPAEEAAKTLAVFLFFFLSYVRNTKHNTQRGEGSQWESGGSFVLEK